MNSNFFTDNECKNPPKGKFAAATRILNHAEQLIYAIQDAKEYAGIDRFDAMLKQVEELRSAVLEYAALNVICETIDRLQDKIGGEQ